MSIYGVKTLKNKLKELGPYLGVKIGSFLLDLQQKSGHLVASHAATF
jgi:hypothetical protein